MSKRSVEVEIIQAGQPRPYADVIHEAYLTFSVPEGQLWASKFPASADAVKPYAKLMVYGWSDEPEWHQSRLKTLEQVSTEPNRWHVIVISPYLD